MSQQQAAQSLRTRQIGDILSAQQYQEEAPSRDVQQQIRAEDLAQKRIATPFLAREKESELAYREALTRKLVSGMPIDQAHTEALTEQIRQNIQDQKDLGDLPKQILQSKLDEARAERQRDVEFDLGNGKKIWTTTDKLMAIIGTKGRAGGELTTQQQITNARADRKEAENRADDSEDAESVMLGRKKAKDGGELNLLDPAARPYADEFNRKSDKPYAYVWGENAERNTIWPNKPGLHKVDLPVAQINGKPVQLTARMLTQMGRASKPPLDMKQMLEVLQRSNTIKGKLPWQ